MMKSLKLIGLFLLIGGCLFTVFVQTSKQDVQKVKSEPALTHFYAKLPPSGKLPRGLMPQWYRKDQQNILSRNEEENPILAVEEKGPFNEGGRTRALLIDLNDNSENTLFAGAVSGGLWTSEDRGQSWKKVDDFAANLNISSISQNPLSPNEIYLGTGEAHGNSSAAMGMGVFKSDDGGKTFTHLASTGGEDFEFVTFVHCSTVKNGHVYAGTLTGGLYKSTDKGGSWEQVFFTPFLRNPNSIIGDYWKPDFFIEVSPVMDMVEFSDGSVIIAHMHDGLYRSETGDAGSFSLISSEAFPERGNLENDIRLGRIAIEQAPSDPKTLYAFFDGYDANPGYSVQNFVKSIDGGQTWTAPWDNTSDEAIMRTAGGYMLLIAVHSEDPNKVLLGSASLYYSGNGGETWQQRSSGYVDHHAYVSFKSNPNEFLIGNDAGVYGNTWDDLWTSNPLKGGYAVTQFYRGFVAPEGTDVRLGGTQDFGIFKITDEGSKLITAGDGIHAYISQQNPKKAYFTIFSGWLMKTENLLDENPTVENALGDFDADNNNYPDEPVSWQAPFQMSTVNDNLLFMLTRGGVWRTTNGSVNWTKITQDFRANGAPGFSGGHKNGDLAITTEENPTLFFLGSKWDVWNIGILNFYRIDNSATTDPEKEVDLNASIPNEVKEDYVGRMRIHPNYPEQDRLLISFQNYAEKGQERPRLYLVEEASTDTPVWRSVSDGLPENLPVVDIQFDPTNPDFVYYAATDYGLYYTIDGGRNWMKETRLPNVAIHEMQIRASDQTLHLFTHGRGAWELKLSDEVLPNPTNLASLFPADFAKIYPNPASDFVQIKLSETGLKSGKNLSASLIDIQGREMRAIDLQKTNQIRISDLVDGVYIVRISDGVRSLNKRVVVRH